MWSDNITPIFTIQLNTPISESKNKALHEVIERFFEPSDIQIYSGTQLIQMIKIFSLLYICKAEQFGLTSLTLSDLKEVLDSKYTTNDPMLFKIKPGYHMSISNATNHLTS